MLTVVLLASALALAGAGWFSARRRTAARQRAADRPVRRAGRILSQDEVRRIRQEAEEAALQVALGATAAGRNPHAAGTRQAVLWTTSFNLRLMELETEAFAPVPPVPVLVR